MDKTTASQREVLRDFAELVAKAFFGGLGVAIAMAAAILALSPAAQAATPDEAKTGTLLVRTSDGSFGVAPKVSTEVGIEVNGPVARTRVSQVFHYPGDAQADGLYVFPLPGHAAVDRVWMRIGERVIEGRTGDTRRDLFSTAIDAIAPGERIEIRIEYEQKLMARDGEYRLRFPLAPTPRYLTPMSARDPMPDVPKAMEAQLDGTGLSAPAFLAAASTNPVDIAVVIDAGSPIHDLRSSYEGIASEKHGSARTALFLVREQDDVDGDFELAWRVPAAAQADDGPRSVAPAPPIEQPSAGTGALWANEADAPATLQFVAACMALAMAGGVTLVGRRMA